MLSVNSEAIGIDIEHRNTNFRGTTLLPEWKSTYNQALMASRTVPRRCRKDLFMLYKDIVSTGENLCIRWMEEDVSEEYAFAFSMNRQEELLD